MCRSVPQIVVRVTRITASPGPGRGRVGFFSQSGALGIAILAAAKERKKRTAALLVSAANLVAHDKRQNLDRDYGAAIRRLS